MNGKARQAAGTARRGDAEDAARAARVRRSAWLLGGLALVFYFGYLAWMFIRGTNGG